MYGLNIKYVFEGGIFPPDVLKITDSTLMATFGVGVGNIAAISMATGFHTEASLPHLIIKGAKNVVALALGAEYTGFPLAEKISKLVAALG